MPKKKVEEFVPQGNQEIESVHKPQIAPLSLDLGRDDLNILVGKVNELIKKVNE